MGMGAVEQMANRLDKKQSQPLVVLAGWVWQHC